MVAERTGPHAPVKLSGSIPPLAEAFHQRPETGLDLRVGLYPGDTVVLTHGEETAVAPARQGGTGKTQIAVAFSHALWGARAVDALVWVPATSREAIVAGFAQAARTVGAACRQAGRLGDAVRHYEQALADSERYLGPDHPLTRAMRENLEATTRT